jgi:transcription elongation factor GreA
MATRLTREGIEKYETRLDYLKTTGRTEIAEQIKIARSFGDLSENAEYDAAKTEQARIEREIIEIESMLRDVEMIDEDNIDINVVGVGVMVKVKNLASNMELDLQIVGSAEADPYASRISNESPVGMGLLGHKAGDVVEVITPGGTQRFEILSIGK